MTLVGRQSCQKFLNRSGAISIMRLDPPTEILLKTEKTTLVLEGIGGDKIRCSAGSWKDAKVILEGQVLGCGPMASGCGSRAGRAPKTPVESNRSMNTSRVTDRASRVMRHRVMRYQSSDADCTVARSAELPRTPYHLRADYDPRQASRTRTPRPRRQGGSRARQRNRGRPASQSLPG